MKTEDLVLDESGKGEIVKEIGEVFPNVGVSIFPQAFVVETVHLCDLAGLVVSAEDGDTLGVSNFQADEECDSLYRVVSTVDIVTWDRSARGARARELCVRTHEEVIRIGVGPSDAEELH